MKYKKDSDNFIHKFSKEASSPDPVFKYQLKQKVLGEFNKQNHLQKLFNNLSQWQFGLLSFSASGLTILAIAFILFSLYGGTNIINPADSGALNENDKSAVMRKIFTANPGRQINPESALGGQGFQTTDINSTNVDPARSNNSNSLYDHKTLTQTYTIGNKSQACKAFTGLPVAVKIISNVALNNDKSIYYINTATYDSNNNIINLNYANNKSQINYVGGKYAIELPSAAIPSTNSNIANTSDSSEVKAVTIEGKKYYSISKNEDAAFCTGNLPGANTPQIISVTQADADNYNIVNIKYYLDSVNANNLLLTIDSTYSEEYRPWDEIKNNFNLSLTTINKVSTSGAATSDQYKFKFLLPQNSDSKDGELSSPDLNANTNYYYLFDRDYYPSGSKGDNLMSSILATLNAEVGLTYSVKYTDQEGISHELQINSSISSDTILATRIKESSDQQVTLNINGQNVTANYPASDAAQKYVIDFNLNHIGYSFTYVGDLTKLPKFTLTDTH